MYLTQAAVVQTYAFNNPSFTLNVQVSQDTPDKKSGVVFLIGSLSKLFDYWNSLCWYS